MTTVDLNDCFSVVNSIAFSIYSLVWKGFVLYYFNSCRKTPPKTNRVNQCQ